MFSKHRSTCFSFIDLYKGKEWQQHNYIALGGVADRALLRFLLEHPQIIQVVLCLDNDDTGLKADIRLKDTLERVRDGLMVEGIDTQIQEKLKRCYEVSILRSELKDWNDELKLNTGNHT